MYTCRYKPMARDARAPPAPPVVAALLIVAALVGVEEAAARRPTAGGAGAGAKDWRHELRRRPRAEVDPATEVVPSGQALQPVDGAVSPYVSTGHLQAGSERSWVYVISWVS